MTSSTLVVVSGLPGAGKTTAAQAEACARGAVRLCPDEWLRSSGCDPFDEPLRTRLEARLTALGAVCLRAGIDVVNEFGCWSVAHRLEQADAARRAGAGAQLIVCEAPLEERVRRVASRSDGVAIDPATLASYDACWEPVGDAEAVAFDDVEHRY